MLHFKNTGTKVRDKLPLNWNNLMKLRKTNNTKERRKVFRNIFLHVPKHFIYGKFAEDSKTIQIRLK